MSGSLGVAPAYHLHHLFWNAMDWLFPVRCAGCGRMGARWCEECLDSIQPIQHQTACPACDFPELHGAPCPDCTRQPPQFDLLRSCTVYQGKMRDAIHRLKYQNDIGLGEALSRHLVKEVQNLNWQVDLICAVPLSRKKLKERGYNQSGLLARSLSWAIRSPYSAKCIQRTRETVSQVGLEASARRRNVEGAFTANPKLVSGKWVLILDDVATTSATLSACADALKIAGAQKVYGLTLARAIQIEQS